MEDLIARTEAYVKEYMSHNDASHDYRHVQRVLLWARKIEAAERTIHPHTSYNSDLIILASLLHDVGDKKYLKPGDSDKAGDDSSSSNSNSLAANFLIANGTDGALAHRVQRIVTHVSYSRETQDPAHVHRVVAEIPELAVVQDADRLDALGAVGIARAFVFGSAMRPDQQGGLEGTLAHFEHKLEKLHGMMKTETGRKEAEVRTRRLTVFKSWWKEEESGGSGLGMTHGRDI